MLIMQKDYSGCPDKLGAMSRLRRKGLTIAEISRRLGVQYRTVYRIRLAERGYKSYKDYYNDLMARKHVIARKHGFSSYFQYKVARELGLQDSGEYQKYLDERRREREGRVRRYRKARRVFSGVVRVGLRRLRKPQAWLASELGVTRQTVFHYTHEIRLPDRRRWSRLASSLRLSRSRLGRLERILDDGR